MDHPDYYALLGISRDAGPEEIKRGFRLARKKAHPDREGGSDELMKLVNRAHECLTDPDRRAIYDATGVDQPQGNEVRELMETLLAEKAIDLLRDGFMAHLAIEDDRKLLKAMRGQLQAAINRAATVKVNAEDAAAKTVMRLGRMTVKEGVRNLVEELLTAAVENHQRAAEDAAHDILVMKAALKLLDEYGTNQPEPLPEFYRPTFSQQRSGELYTGSDDALLAALFGSTRR